MRLILRLMVALSLLCTGCGGEEGNSVWKAICDATCARGVECFPEGGSVAQCVPECLGEIGNPPCDRNDAAIEACVEEIGELSCEDLADGLLPSPSCFNVCTGNDLCANTICDDGDDCTDNVCSPIDTSCSYPPSEDGLSCANGAGSCVQGSCEAEFPCTEQGVRDAVEVVGGPHTFSCDGPTTVTTEDGIIIDKDVILDGEDNLTLDGNDRHRMLYVRASSVGAVEVELRRLTVMGGRVEEPGCSCGGGIRNEGVLTLTSCTISGNTAMASQGPEPLSEDVAGGGIWNQGILTLTNSTVSNNRTTGAPGIESGGGIYGDSVGSGIVTLVDSAVSGNTTGGNGGGIYLQNGAVVLMNTTVSQNEAARSGGGIVARGELSMINSTVSGNTANESAGGIFGVLGTLAVTSSTIAGNSTVGASLSGGGWTVAGSVVAGNCTNVRMSSSGYNIESPGNTCGFDQASDLVERSTGELNLGELADNGGPTMTHALLPGSVAIDHVSEAACIDADGALLTKDQRGVPRPQGPACDAGAFELEEATVTVTGTVTYAGSGAPVDAATVSVLDTAVGTATDAQGRFTLDVPVGSVFFQISKEGTWGQIELEMVLTTRDLTFEVVEDSLVAEIEEFLMIDFSETQGVVDVIFDSPSGLGGETATLSVPFDSSLTFDAAEQPVLSDQLVPGGGEDLVFVGVDLTEELIVSPMGVGGVNACDLENPGTVYPVLVKSFTRVRQVRCTPLP